MIKHFEWFFTDWIRTSDHPWDIWTRMYVVYWLKHITAKESWLRQFVCENGMLNIEYDITKSYKDSRDRVHHWWYNWDRYLEWFDMYNYKYRLIESALCDEDKLEQFLLDNIKIDGE